MPVLQIWEGIRISKTTYGEINMALKRFIASISPI